MTDRALQKEATAKAVLGAARAEFERVGFEAANLRSIAAQAGVAAGTVIHHFGDKRELLHAALFEDLELTVAGAIGRLGRGSLKSRLMTLTREVFAYYERRPALSRTLLKESLFADPPWAARFAGQVAKLHGAIEGLVAGAIARGELRSDVNGALLGAAYFSYFYFALISWVQGAHPAPVDLVEKLLRAHLDALRPSALPAKARRR